MNLTQPASINEREADFYIRAAYLAFLGREPDPEGLNNWRDHLLRSGDPLDVVSRLVHCNEYQQRGIGDGGLSIRTSRSDKPSAGLIGRALRRIRRTLRLPGTHAGLEMQQRTALLSAWVAHASQNEASTPTAGLDSLGTGLDRLNKEQIALAWRLLSIEEDLAASHAENERRESRLLAIEEEQARQRSGGPVAVPGVSTQAFEDVRLNLTTGPYGRFLTIVPDLIGGAIERGEFWDPHLKPIIERCADPTRTAIDAGAYIGFHSVFLAKHFGRVYAFEPQPRCFRLLNANVELNGCDRVHTYNRPLYDAEIPMELASGDLQQIPLKLRNGAIDYAEIGNAAALAFVPVDSPQAARVRAATIDSLELRDVGFIKVDTQGCDFRVLRGAGRTISACRPTIVFEFEEKLASYHGDTLEELRQFFSRHDYDVTEISHSGALQWDFLATPRG